MSQIKLTADSGGGTTSLKAPSSTTSNADVVLKLPVADGSSGQVLKTDGSGQLSFTSNAGTTINNNADNRVITGSGTASTLNGESGLTYSSNELTVTEQITIDAPDNVTSIGGDYALRLLGGDANNDIVNLRFATGADGSLAGISALAEVTGSYPNSSGALLLCVQAGGAVYEALRINSARNVGIGTTSPSTNLHVKGSGELLRLETTAAGGGQCYIDFDDETATRASIGMRGSSSDTFTIASVNSSLRFDVQNKTQAMNIDTDGKVGIGTTSPQTPLHVNGGDLIISDTNAPNIRIVNASDSAGDSSNKGTIGVASGANNFFNGVAANEMCYVAPDSSKHLFGFGNSIKFRIDSDGKLFSAATYNNTTSSSSRAVVMPNNTGEFFASTSSRKFKTNINTLTDALADKILQCRPVSFNSTCAGDNKSKIFYGLIAEEVHEIDTSLVAYEDETAETPEPTSVQYDRFVPHLINIVKRQKAQIETLETKVAALEAK